MSQITYKERSLSHDRWRLMILSASCGSALPQAAQSIAVATLMNTSREYTLTSPQSAAVKGPTIWKQISDAITQYKRYRRLVKKAGRDLNIPFYRAQDIEVEVQRYKWIEAEKAGRDIWQERNPNDPEGVALRDWVSHYLEKWKTTNINKQQSA